jgi:hypothetical protein
MTDIQVNHRMAMRGNTRHKKIEDRYGCYQKHVRIPEFSKQKSRLSAYQEFKK